MTRIELDDGKYTVVHDSGAGLHALRYGEHWRDMTGDGLVLAMAQEIEDLRRRIAPVQQVSAPDDMRSLAQRLREYNQNPHHINPMSEAFHILVADAANALSTACVPKEIAAAITWSEHLLFECGALTSTRAPSAHVYNKTFAAVNEARAMLAAATAAPAADAGDVLEQAMYTLISIGYHENSGLVHELRQALAAHRAQEVE